MADSPPAATSAPAGPAPAPAAPRLFASLPATYLIVEGPSSKQRKVCTSRTRSIGADLIALDGCEGGAVGSKVAVNIKPLGIVRGEIARQFAEGCFVEPRFESDEQKSRFNARIGWFKRYLARQARDLRHEERAPGANRPVTFRQAGGDAGSGGVLDVSCSGAAITSPSRPEIGSAVTAGGVTGTVVRHLPDGFAIKFDSAFAEVAAALRSLAGA